MGKKKKAQKTKELSVAIAEASSGAGGGFEEEAQSPPPQVQTPRRRGRPRKISTDDKVMSGGDEKQQVSVSDVEAEDHPSKKAKIDEEKKEGSRSSRARRKSKPRKSS